MYLQWPAPAAHCCWLTARLWLALVCGVQQCCCCSSATQHGDLDMSGDTLLLGEMASVVRYRVATRGIGPQAA